MRDEHRGLVTREDRIGNLAQIRALVAGGYGGHFSFEPFSAEVRGLDRPAEAIRRSMDLIREGISVAA